MFRIVFGNQNTANVTKGLTGVAATCAVGAVGLSLSMALSGVLGTGAVGTVFRATTEALTGVSATGSVGTITAVTQVSSLDQRSREIHTWPRPFAPTAFVTLRSPQSGNRLSQSAGETIGVTGVSGTGAAGNLAESLAYPLTGNTATGSVGFVVTDVSQSAALTGVVSTGAVGTLTAENTVALTGNAVTGAVGSVSETPNIVLTGVQAIGSVGTVVGSGGTVQTGPVGSETIIGTYVTSEELIGTVDG